MASEQERTKVRVLDCPEAGSYQGKHGRIERFRTQEEMIEALENEDSTRDAVVLVEFPDKHRLWLKPSEVKFVL